MQIGQKRRVIRTDEDEISVSIRALPQLTPRSRSAQEHEAIIRHSVHFACVRLHSYRDFTRHSRK